MSEGPPSSSSHLAKSNHDSEDGKLVEKLYQSFSTWISRRAEESASKVRATNHPLSDFESLYNITVENAEQVLSNRLGEVFERVYDMLACDFRYNYRQRLTRGAADMPYFALSDTVSNRFSFITSVLLLLKNY